MNDLTNHSPVPNIDELERLFMLSPALLCIAGTDGYFKRVNPAFEAALGYRLPDLLARPILDLVHPDDRESTLAAIRDLAAGMPASNFENRYRHANGSYRWLLWNTVSAEEDELLYAIAIDITERKHADEKYRDLERKLATTSEATERKLQDLANRLVLAEENERRRIARGLHDEVSQSLLAAKMATEELGDGLTSDQESLARQAQNLLTHAIRTMRSLTFELASAALYDVGLGAAMQSLCDRAQEKSGIEFQPPQILPGNPIPEPTRVILYRAGRELIQNVVKHSQARTAKLALTLADDVIRLCVRDDGCGFDVEKLRDEWQVNQNFGLFSITQQLQPLGGELEIVSTPGSGTRATLIVPLALEKAAI